VIRTEGARFPDYRAAWEASCAMARQRRDADSRLRAASGASMRPLEEVFEDAKARFADVSALRCRAL
jgi:hypothetical protein